MYHHPLGAGREVWFGHHQSIRASQWKLMLNIDVSATAFYKSMPVMEFLCQVLDHHSLSFSKLGFTDVTNHMRVWQSYKGINPMGKPHDQTHLLRPLSLPKVDY